MRLDKFIKVARLIKRRSVANEACDLGRVTINGKPAKAGKDLALGDVIGIRFGDKECYFKIKEIPAGNVSKDHSEKLYEVVEKL
ncbi:MAG: RNA-binding S4 domain-containing protein [Christensenellaceae bacterium]|jgi:ribosomal 50S subunit-recycling heat shock protein|nr:RNA-binding S4 domain-containing protein [Christensenellaceae bacterium]